MSRAGRTFRKTRRASLTIGIVTGIISASSVSPVSAQPASLYNFFGQRGCAIGPETRAEAREAGYEPKPLDVTTETARRHKETVRTGEWLVLPPELCTIQLPQPARKLSLTDPEVQKAFSARDAQAAEGYPGCFLNVDTLFDELRKTRLWDNDTIFLEYIRLLGASLVSGEVAFYSNSPLSTPVGFQLLTGDCADVPEIERIRQNHRLLVTHFDPIIRANAAYVRCDRGESTLTMELPDVVRKVAGQESPNAWIGMEIQIIAMSAGWYKGMSYTNKGTPRPPVCTSG